MYPEVVFVDATVLCSRATRDWLLHIRSASNRGMYVIACSRDVIIEALNTLRNLNPTWPGRLTTDLLSGLMDALDIIDDFDGDIAYTGADPHDRHVHAAAVASGAGFLVTDDKRFFRMASDDLPYEVITADQFFVLVDDGHPHVVAEATRNQLRYWAARKVKAELAGHLETAGCPDFAQRIRNRVKIQAGALSRAERRLVLDTGDYDPSQFS